MCSSDLVITQGGKIRKLNVASGAIETIAFSAKVHRTISEQAFAPRTIRDDSLKVAFLRWASRSPDGRHATFEAAGKLWIVDLPSGTPRRLTPVSFTPVELSPAWSADGRWIAFTSFDDEKLGHVWKIPAAGGQMTQLTKVAGEYLQPAWAPDGRELVVTRGTGGFLRQHSVSNNTWYELRRIGANGEFDQRVTDVARTLPFPVELLADLGGNLTLQINLGRRGSEDDPPDTAGIDPDDPDARWWVDIEIGRAHV